MRLKNSADCIRELILRLEKERRLDAILKIFLLRLSSLENLLRQPGLNCSMARKAICVLAPAASSHPIQSHHPHKNYYGDGFQGTPHLLLQQYLLAEEASRLLRNYRAGNPWNCELIKDPLLFFPLPLSLLFGCRDSCRDRDTPADILVSTLNDRRGPEPECRLRQRAGSRTSSGSS